MIRGACISACGAGLCATAMVEAITAAPAAAANKRIRMSPKITAILACAFDAAREKQSRQT